MHSFQRLESKKRLSAKANLLKLSISAVPEAQSVNELNTISFVNESLGVSVSMATDNLDESTYSKTERSNRSYEESKDPSKAYNARLIYSQNLKD